MLAFIVFGVIISIVIMVRVGMRNNNSTNQSKTTPRTIRCPNCGSQATVKGDHWECGWCGDYGLFR